MSPLQGFSGANATQGFQAGQALHVQGAGSGMLMDLVAEWKRDRAQKQEMGQKKELIDYETEAGIKKLGFGEMFKQTFKNPIEYQTDLQSAVDAMSKTADEDKKTLIYQRIASKYPDKSGDLKRILLPKTSTSDYDIIAAIRGE